MSNLSVNQHRRGGRHRVLNFGGHGLGKVVALVGDDIADTAAWIGDVTVISRNDVDVEVVHGLAGGRARVETDVESVGSVLLVDRIAHSIDKSEDIGSFLGSRLPPIGELSPCDDQERGPG